MSFAISTTRHAKATVVAIEGDIDVQTAPGLRDALDAVIRDDTGGVVIDLTATTFLDSTALGVMVGADNQLRSASRAFALVCPNQRLLKIFQISRLDSIWPMYDSLSEALA